MNQPTLFEMPTRVLPQSTIGKMCQELMDSDGVILDTETTGLTSEDEVIQIAIVSMTGEVLLESFVQPIKAQIHPSAYEVHKISQRQLSGSPLLKSLGLIDLLNEKYIVGYNVGFDMRLLCQSAQANQDKGLYDFLHAEPWSSMAQKPYPGKAHWLDFCEPYAKHWREPRKQGGHKKQKLVDACAQQGIKVGWKHQALDDARLTLELIRALADDQSRRFK